MSGENKEIKKTLLKLFEKGKSEAEAFVALSKTQNSSKSISLKLVSNWFAKFRLEEGVVRNEKKSVSKLKISDEFIIDLVNNNPELGIIELAELAGVSKSTISSRLRQINKNGERVKYNTKRVTKLTDEFVVNLVNNNPGNTMAELAQLGNTSQSSLSRRLKQINSKRNEDSQIVLEKSIKTERKMYNFITDESLISLINKNPDKNMAELAKIANVATSVVSIRLKKINIDGEKAKYIKKYHSKLTDEYLINLVNENPKLNTYDLAKLANVSHVTIFNKINELNKGTKQVNYVNKSSKLTDEYIFSLVNSNPEASISDLSKLANVSVSAISKRIANINNNGKGVNYIGKARSKITDELVIKLISQNPEMNMTDIGKLAGVTGSAISYRIKKINKNGERVTCGTNRNKNSKLDYSKAS
jgi:DNA-binding Lrp family transcriptional regulator